MRSSSKLQALNVKGEIKMSTAHAIQTAIELLMIVAVVVGIIYEPALAKWEKKQGEKMLKAFNKRKEYRR